MHACTFAAPSRRPIRTADPQPILRLVVAGLLALLLPNVVGAQPTTTRVSVATDGSEGNAISVAPAISADGRWIAFQSSATNLVAGDTNGASDVFVHDRQTGTTTRVSVGPGGLQANGQSFRPAISADGRWVAFESEAVNLVPGGTNGFRHVFVHDRQTGETTRVSVDSGGAEGDGHSFTPAISADGRWVAFRSFATNLVAGDTNGVEDVFVHDRQSGTTTRVSVGPGGAQANGESYAPAISADGRWAVFVSRANNLVAGDTNSSPDVFVHDRETATTTRVSLASGGVQSDGDSRSPAISANGRWVVFDSLARTLVADDTNEQWDVFVRDLQAGTTTRVSLGPGGTEGNDESADPAISADGRWVTFASSASTLVASDTNGVRDVFARDRQAATTLRVSLGTGDVEGNGASDSPASSADGNWLVFVSKAANLVAGDGNDALDVFLRDRDETACTFTLAPASALAPIAGTSGTVLVLGSVGCAWTAVSNDPSWLTVTDGSSGTGFGIVSYTAAANPGAGRTGTLTIAGLTFTLEQANATRVIGLSGDLAFGPVEVGTTATRTLTISNSGNSPLTVSGIAYPTGFSGAWSGTLPPGASQDVPVTFAPTAAISYGGTVIVTADQTSGTNTIAASGTGTPVPTRIIGLSGNLAFGPVGVNTTATRTLTISNTGNTTLTVSGISYPAGFSGAWNGTLLAGASHDVTVTFAPTAAIAYGGTVTVTANQTSGTNTIAASGTGVAATRVIGLSGNLAFGSVAVGTTANRTLTISNTGNATLTVSGISYPAGFSGAWSGTVPAGMSHDVTVTFAPAAVGSYGGTITVSADQTGGTPTIAVSGTGTQPTLALDRSALHYGAVNASGTLTSQTSAQTVTLTQTGSPSLAWTATASQPWIQVSPASGTGSATFSVAVVDTGTLPATGTLTGTIVVTASGAATAPSVAVSFRLYAPGGSRRPIGTLDVPSGLTTVSGSIVVGGWAVDDVEISRIEVYRARVPGEPLQGVLPLNHPGYDKIYVATAEIVRTLPFGPDTALFIDGARPDIEGLFPASPWNYRAGWGYLMLTWGLPNQGTGTYTLYAYAFDRDGNYPINYTLLGSRTFTSDNRATTELARKPFGAIDAPFPGETVTGVKLTGGWALTQPVTCSVTSVQVALNSGAGWGPLLPVIYGDLKPGFESYFPTGSFSNSPYAGAAYFLDSTGYANGVHQIGYLVQDSCGHQEGIGSRFFTIFNASASVATESVAANAVPMEAAGTPVVMRPPDTADAHTAFALTGRPAAALRVPRAQAAVRVARGYGQWGAPPAPTELPVPDARGVSTVAARPLERVVVHLPATEGSGKDASAVVHYEGYQSVGGQLRRLPVGSSLDTRQGLFYWEPGPGFLGSYDLVFVRKDASGASVQVPVRVEVRDQSPPPADAPLIEPVPPEPATPGAPPDPTTLEPAAPAPPMPDPIAPAPVTPRPVVRRTVTRELLPIPEPASPPAGVDAPPADPVPAAAPPPAAAPAPRAGFTGLDLGETPRLTADAGPDQTIEANAGWGTATLRASVSEAHADATYRWSGAFGMLEGREAAVTLPLGAHTIELTVEADGQTSRDTLVVVVGDSTPPLIEARITPAPDADGVLSAPATVSWVVTDPESSVVRFEGCQDTRVTTSTTVRCAATNGVGRTAVEAITLTTRPPRH